MPARYLAILVSEPFWKLIGELLRQTLRGKTSNNPPQELLILILSQFKVTTWAVSAEELLLLITIVTDSYQY